MNIRTYCEADRLAVITLWNEVFPNPAPHNDPGHAIDCKQSAEDELFFVACDGSDVVGTVMGGYDGHRGWVYSLAVAPEGRRRGIGSQLMRRLEDELLRRGCDKVNLQVRSGNEQVLAFYQELGYDVEERISMGKLLSLPKSSAC